MATSSEQSSPREITLEEIWQASRDEISTLLLEVNLPPTKSSDKDPLAAVRDLNYDRAVVAQLYDEEGFLQASDAIWVRRDDWLEVMAAKSTLHEGLRRLQSLLVRKLLTLHLIYSVSVTTAEDLTGTVAGEFAQGAARQMTGSAIVDVLTPLLPHVLPIETWDGYRILQDQVSMDTDIDPENEEPVDIGAQMATATWENLLERIPEIEQIVLRTDIPYVKWDPVEVLTALSNVNLINMLTGVKCYFLYSLWEMVQLLGDLPHRSILEQQIQNLAEEHDCMTLFAPQPEITPGILLGDLLPFVEAYQGWADRDVVLQRLAAL